MDELPDRELAILELRKLSDYCLNPAHPRGRHKARLFRDALGIGPHDATWLRKALLSGLAGAKAEFAGRDQFGTRWRCDIPIARQERRAVVRTVWIVPEGEKAPRLVTCWVL